MHKSVSDKIHVLYSEYKQKGNITMRLSRLFITTEEIPTEEIPDKPIDGKPTLVDWNIVGLALPTFFDWPSSIRVQTFWMYESRRGIRRLPISWKPESFNNGDRGYGGCESPKDYKYHDDPYQRCNNTSCSFDRMKEGKLASIPNVKDLQKCSRCLVVRYCSKECQRKDWKEHKKQCENLSIWRKDQDKIQELTQQFWACSWWAWWAPWVMGEMELHPTWNWWGNSCEQWGMKM